MKPRLVAATVSCVLVGAAVIAGCGGDTLGVATTVVQVTPTNFATIPPVASTAPGTTTTLPQGAIGEEKTYTVQPGDSPLGVANRFSISLTTLLAYNGWVTPSQFPYPGEIVRIPPQAVVNPDTGQQTGEGGTGTGTNAGGAATTGCAARPAGTYKVQPNDSMFKIREKFCVSLGSLLNANGWVDSGVTLLPGQTINIPAAGS